MDFNTGNTLKSVWQINKWLILLLLLLPATAYSLGLGPITMRSALNQPLLAEIDVHSIQEGDLDGLSVKMASAEDFKRISVEKSSFLNKIIFEVKTRADGAPFIQLSTDKPVTEPYLDFLIEARWPRGRALKEYTVLVDPPVLTAEAPAPVQQARTEPVVPKKVSPRVAPRPTPRRATSTTQRFKPADRSEQVARPEPTPVRPRRAPQREEVASLDEEPRSEGSLNYGRVRRNDTLSEIAQKMKPSDVTLQQMMLALLKSNPQAFIDGNINRLKAGAELRIDDPSLLSELSRREAFAEVSRQNTAWRAGRTVKQIDVASNDFDSERGSSSESSSESTGDESARLKLVAPGTKGVGTGGSTEDSGSEAAQLKENLLLATEALDANRQESTELKGRLTDLEEQLESMQRLINLKDQEMAKLQAGLKQQQDEDVQAPAENVAKEEAAKPQEAVKTDGSFLSDATIYAIIIFLVICVVAVMVMRRRKMQDGFEESILNVGMHDDVMSPDDFSASMGRSDFSRAQSVGSMASGFAVSDISGIHAETTDVDPISEADVYLAYGRHQQAEDILLQAIAKDESRMDVHTKLLEVYKASNKQQEFEKHAQRVNDLLGGDESGPEWHKIATMGMALCPSSPLFGGGPAAAPTGNQSNYAADLGSVTAEEEDLLDFDFEAGSELDLGGGDLETDGDNSLDFDISSLDFSLDDDLGLDEDATQQVDDNLAALDNFDKYGSSDNDDNSLDFDMDSTMSTGDGEVLDFGDLEFNTGVGGDDGSPIELVGNDNAEVAFEFDDGLSDEPIELTLDDDALTLEEVDDFDDEEMSGEFDEDIFANVDEIGSKLDLAKAYVDMGDSDGAKSILDEVLEEGDDTQKEQAHQLLQQMG